MIPDDFTPGAKGNRLSELPEIGSRLHGHPGDMYQFLVIDISFLDESYKSSKSYNCPLVRFIH